MRSDNSFDSLWIKLQSESDRVGVNDINRDILDEQLQLIRSHFDKSENSTVTLPDILKFASEQSVLERELFSEVVVLFKILLVMPATNATSERTFSVLRRIKTYLRSTMSQVRLNNPHELEILSLLFNMLMIISKI
jgi:hypothetical protein